MNTLADRIRTLRKTHKMTQAALAKTIGITTSAINQWESGLVKNLTGENLLKTAKALQVNPDWLATGKGQKDPKTHINNVTPAPDIKGLVPVLSWVKAGNWSEAIENIDNEYICITTQKSPRTFALRVDGDSMEPEFFHGDIIIVEPEMEPMHGDFVIAKNGGNATFKQLWREGSDWYLKPLNTRYPIKPLDDSHIIGVIREKIKIYR